MTTGSEASDEDKPEEYSKGRIPRVLSTKARQGVGFMKTYFRKSRSHRVPRSAEAVLPNGKHSILREPDVHSIGTLTVRHRNTKKPRSLPGDSDDPAILLKRARRYKKKAKRLLDQAVAAHAAEGRPQKKDARDIEALARKSYRYAAESRRVYDLARKKMDLISLKDAETAGASSQVIRSSNSVGQNSVRRRPDSKKTSSEEVGYSPSVKDDDDSIFSELTSFSQKVERDERRRKLKELELFGAADFGPLTCGKSDELGQQYAQEANIIVHSLRDVESITGDNISVMSPGSVHSDETTLSEAAAQLEHERKMKELELFTASDVMLSWNSWVQSFWTGKTAMQAIKEEERDTSHCSLDEESHKGGSLPMRGLCGPNILEDDVLGDNDTAAENLQYTESMAFEDDLSGAYDHFTSGDEEDDSSCSVETEVASDDGSEDESEDDSDNGSGSESGSGSSAADSDDESEDDTRYGHRRGVFSLLFDKR